MPLYSYRCAYCGTAADRFAAVDDRHMVAPRCNCVYSQGARMTLEICAPYVSPDIQPYIALAGDRAGKPITSRREHREYLKRNKLVEVGDAPIRDTKTMRKPIETDRDRRDLREQMRPVVAEAVRRGKK